MEISSGEFVVRRFDPSGGRPFTWKREGRKSTSESVSDSRDGVAELLRLGVCDTERRGGKLAITGGCVRTSDNPTC